MSYSQSGFWFLGQYLEDPTAFNITIWIRVKGSIDASRLGRAVDLVAQSTESLRTVFTTSEGKPCQKIMERSEFHLDQQPVESQAEFMNIFKALERHIYDIEHGDTVKLLLCKESDDLFYIALGFHHILMDAISTDIIIGNVQHAYEAETFVNTQLQYAAWAKNQRAYVESQDSSKDRAYWSQEFATIPPVLPLFPMSQQSSRKALKSYHMIRANISLGADTTARIKERCRSQSVSPAYFHLTVWKTLLFRFLAVNDICIGITDMNRTSAEDAGAYK
jgi:hybrid polyketide synthase/nonribosomal peptide synthetase ACE1